MKSDRVLKVSSITTIYDRLEHNSYGMSQVPFIKLAGKYLEKAGINIGDHVRVVIRENQVYIEKV